MTGLRRLLRETSGAALVEATLVLPMLFVLTFGLAEFGGVLWQYNAAEKATAEAARLVATGGPLVTGVEDCFVTTSEPAGTSCADVAGSEGWTGICGSGADGTTCNAAFVTEVMARIHQFAPFIDEENVQIELRGSGLGFVGRGRPVPIVTVRLVGQTFDFIALDDLLGFDPINMPGFDATTVAEDQNEGPWT